MKSLKIFAVLVLLIMAAWVISQETFAQNGYMSFQVFYDNLSPYGMWVDYPNYGYVWIPNTDPGFSPYATNGHWVYTDYGWTWVSDYPWGWAAFHYGRWDYDDVYGWFWVPGNEWGPAWVSWRRSPGYYGWAPLRPGISITIAFGSGYHEPDERWVFVRDRDIARSDIGHHYVERERNVTIINNSTTIVNVRNDNSRNTTYITGPDRNDVQKVTHSSVRTVAVRENSQPGQRISHGELQIYRPQVQKAGSNERKPAPPKVMKLTDVKPIAQRNTGNQPRTVNQSNNNGKQQKNAAPPSNRVDQKQNAAPPRIKDKQQQNAVPDNNKGRQPQSIVPHNNRGEQPQHVAPNNNKGRQPQSVAPNNSSGRQQQHNTAPNNNKQKQQPNKAPSKDNQHKPDEKKQEH